MTKQKKGGPQAAPACQKSLAEFAAISGEDFSIIFGRGVYVDENTSRPANVRIGRCWRTMSALRQGANFLSKYPQVFRQFQAALRPPNIFSIARCVGGCQSKEAAQKKNLRFARLWSFKFMRYPILISHIPYAIL